VILAPLEEMWPHYPIDSKESVATLVGGSVGRNIVSYDWDTCCIRLSRALNYSGRPVQGFAGMANPYMDGPNAKVRAARGADGKSYIYSCYDLRVYLQNRFGRAKTFFGSFEANDLSQARGIIMFAFRHVDLWDGSSVRYNTEFTDGTKKVTEILIWKTPS
jgi:Type VI secretion system (T6SS), amidase effector protein 4